MKDIKITNRQVVKKTDREILTRTKVESRGTRAIILPDFYSTAIFGKSLFLLTMLTLLLYVLCIAAIIFTSIKERNIMFNFQKVADQRLGSQDMVARINSANEGLLLASKKTVSPELRTSYMAYISGKDNVAMATGAHE